MFFFFFFLTRLLQSFLNTDSRQPSMVGTIHTLNFGFSHLAASSLSSMIFLLNSKLLASNLTVSCGTSGQYGYDFLSLELWELETTLCKKPHIHNSYPLLYLKNDSPLVSPSFWSFSLLGTFSSAFKSFIFKFFQVLSLLPEGGAIHINNSPLPKAGSPLIF